MSDLRWKWRSLVNWAHGLAFSPVGRCRKCSHTTPYHYRHCPKRVSR